LFKKKLISAVDDEEDDDYEYISDENGKNPTINSTSIKNDSSSSGLSTKDKKVRYKSVFYAKMMKIYTKLAYLNY